ncbi:protein Wnt-5 isoform X2 [Drosophila kikkawai]|uniref:Protein Wnt n=1 Tax=Drosophila kikkawai TaxID=30033 RepID=A0ABM3C7A8_DROKI|nr:protein Wnt-5 [Drosophila kikkawai]XP_041632441.1 protein Wnt-5 [Drosophila kikkawai]XP_041632442.1 protein Wnt-5 [Drosophila kikkawai]
MILITRKHFLYICILLLTPSYDATGLQGVPSWICLGLKSPFIKFGIKEEELANTSIPLNITKDEQAYMHQEGLRKLGTFIKPIDLRDSTTGFVKADLTKRLTFDPPSTASRRIHPIQEEMNQKQIILLDEDTDENGLPASLTDEDRKFIVPMALKNISPDPRLLGIKPTSSVLKNEKSTIASSSSSTQLTISSTSNIDDLKKHILFLHNMTKTNTNFESKFVKFPSLQKDKTKPLDGNFAKPVKRPQRPIFQYSAPIAPPTHKVLQESPGYHQINNSSDVNIIDADKKISTETQVPLLYEIQSTTAPADAQIIPIINTTPVLRTTKRPPCLRNPDSPKCIRQRRREEQQRQRERDDWFRGQSEYIQPNFQPIVQTINNTKRFAVSIEIPDSFKVHSTFTSASKRSEEELLSRLERSQPRTNNHMDDIEIGSEYNPIPFSKTEGYYQNHIVMTSANVASEQDFLSDKYNVSSVNENNNDTSSDSYTEQIDINPKNCFGINGLSYSQKKQCVKHTSVMPAISRGARAAIQECQFQFKNRRWNCSVTNDETVFGPMTSIAAPEMAFIHALAAATVTSFIARACRDGQLASCGCSRGTRPKQLHDDWSWGGCGDNLEYAYKFATDFIDVREKEANRETRGVNRNRAREGIKKIRMQADDTKISEDFNIEIKKSEKDLQQTQSNKLKDIPLKNNSKSSSTHQDLLELQQRITKEIFNSKLKESEMLELKDKINREIINSKFFNGDIVEQRRKGKRKNQRAVIDEPVLPINRFISNAKENDNVGIQVRTTAKARSLMNLHNNEAGRRAVIKKTRITCKCHGVSGSCSLITCWQQLSSIREIGDYLRGKYEQATKVKINKRGRLQVKDSQFDVPTAHDLIYMDESPDWCRTSHIIHWPGTHGRVCRKNSSGLDSCAILCCGRGYNTKNIIVNERCNCKFHWCCQVKCQVCTKVLEEHTCK